MRKNKTTDIAFFLQKAINQYKPEGKIQNVGKILQIGDGVAKVSGLSKIGYHELVAFDQKTFGLALSLEKDSVGVIILGPFQHLKAGDQATATGKILQLGVSDKMIGRIIDPLGRPIDGKPAIVASKNMPLERIAPGVLLRGPVNTPVQTGITAIDAIIPIGRGQRELIIGDRSTGKSSIPLTTIINQKGKNMICIYVAIGQKESFIAQTAATLEKFGAMEHTIIVAASASDSASLQYLAPYTGCTIGEFFAEKGQDALVVYDDLSKHAWAYREISLLLKRPSGREAYPGDVFYLHSRLLERACKYSKKHGSGSLTALPIIETQAGDLSAYIPTNVISITDGQIYLEPDLFYNGIRPAINVGLSVSRVGGAAQIKAMKQVAGKLRLEMAAYRELAAFSQFSSDLDSATKAQIDRGARITEILKQGWDEPRPIENQVLLIFAATNGYLDKIPVDKIKTAEKKLLEFMERKYKNVLKNIAKQKTLDELIEKELRKALEAFLKDYGDEFAEQETSNTEELNKPESVEKTNAEKPEPTESIEKIKKK